MKYSTLTIFILLGFLFNCMPSLPNRPVVGEKFPSIKGESLAGEVAQLPQSWSGKYILVLVGYKRQSQFDIDRWILGASQAALGIRIVELPTVGGLFSSVFGDRLNESMRRGIPNLLWPDVITVYEEADTLYQWLGTQKPNNTRVLLLDKSGNVRWFSDQGYSADGILEIKALITAPSNPLSP